MSPIQDRRGLGTKMGGGGNAHEGQWALRTENTHVVPCFPPCVAARSSQGAFPTGSKEP